MHPCVRRALLPQLALLAALFALTACGKLGASNSAAPADNVVTAPPNGDPTNLGQEGREKRHIVPDLHSFDASDPIGFLGVRANQTTPRGLLNMRVETGGKPKARAVFEAIVADPKLTWLPSYQAGSIGPNDITCSVFFDPSSGNDKTARAIKITRLSYREHHATGLAWLEVVLLGPNGEDGGDMSGERKHRIIFLDRACPAAASDTAAGICAHSNVSNNDVIDRATVKPYTCPAGPSYTYPTPANLPPDDDGGGGGSEM